MVAWLPSWIGRLLRNIRAGADKTLYRDPSLATVPESIVVESGAFAAGGSIPVAFTADGQRRSPPLAWRGVPATARCIAVLVEDADSPTSAPFVHLVAWGGAGIDASLPGGAFEAKSPDSARPGLKLGLNGLRRLGYTPPDPPPGHGQHVYAFQVYALDREIELDRKVSRPALADALRRHAVAKGELRASYERP
jgi:Raf kinase inhibitor-like YbhB/YbcL family protein